MYDPKPEYIVIPGEKILIKDFYDYAEDFVVRPPYQRKNVWDISKQKALLDSLFRRYYIPKIVIREVRINDEETKNFFNIIQRDNNRMQHLALLTRFLLIEFADGPADLKESDVAGLIDKYKSEDGIGDYSFEETKEAKAVLGIMNTFYNIFKSDPMIDEESGVKELTTEYFIISTYLLLRHLKKYYTLTTDNYKWFSGFIIKEFYPRLSDRSEDDSDIQVFISNRQQSKAEIESRDRIIRQIFFEYLKDNGYGLFVKDEKRTFDEAQRIKIYRRDEGLCQECLREGKSEVEARVSWSVFQADHVLPHSKGGQTIIKNGQVLCRYHNIKKGNKIE